MLRIFGLLLLAACLELSFVAPASAMFQKSVRYVCSMHPDVKSAMPGKCPRCEMKLVARSSPARSKNKRRPKGSDQRPGATNRNAAQSAGPVASGTRPTWASMSPAERLKEMERLAPTYEYTCVMHPEVRSAQEGLCPRCGMPLGSVEPSVLGEYGLELTSTPPRPEPHEKVQLRFIVSHPQTGARVKEFVMMHEKLFHLFIISQDMEHYQHIHPQLQPDGSYIVETALPQAGLYKAHSDFFPVGGTVQVIHREILTAGRQAAPVAIPATLTPDETLTKTVDGMKISLKLGTVAPLAGAFVNLKYDLTDEKTGEPVRNLEPYLGAWGHTLILNADQSHYLHSHPTEMLPEGADRATMRGGPKVEFGTYFPEAGPYRIWTQFQRGGKVTTVTFTIKVQPPVDAGR